MTRVPRSQGFTLLELLVSAAVMGILLSLLGNVMVVATRTHRTSAQLAELQQRAEIATQLLTYEVGLAGYRGVDEDLLSNDFGGPSMARLVIGKHSSGGSDTLRTLYYEDRYLSGSSPVLQDVTYSVTSSGGESSLSRQLASGTMYSALAGVTRLEVVSYIRNDGTVLAATPGTPIPSGANPLVALEIEVGFDDDHVTAFTIGIENLDLENYPEQATVTSAD